MRTELRARIPALRARGGRRLEVGITVAPTRMLALLRTGSRRGARDGRVWEREIAPPADDGQWPGLAEALAELRAELGGARLRASLALTPPLAQAKVLRVPPVAAPRLGQLVQRNARRYFATAAEPLVVDARPLGRPVSGEMPRVLAACVGEATLRGIVRATEAAGIEVAGITAASAALTRATGAQQRREAGTVAVIVSADGWKEILCLHGDGPQSFQPLPDLAPPELGARIVEVLERSAQAGAPCDRTLLLCADEAEAEALANELAARGAPERVAADTRGTGTLSPALAAARAALQGSAALPQLLTGELAEARRGRERRQTAALLAACVPILMAAAGVHLWGLERELAAVEESRQALAAEVAEAMQARRATESLRGWLETLAATEQEAAGTRWSEIVASLAAALPDSAYVTSLVADTAQLQLSGFARGAHVVVPALQATPGFAAAAFSAPLQRDESSGRERFELTIPLAPVQGEPSAAPGGAP